MAAKHRLSPSKHFQITFKAHFHNGFDSTGFHGFSFNSCDIEKYEFFIVVGK